MNPAAIRGLIDHAGELVDQRTKRVEPVLTGFTMSWVAWEALRTRLLRVVIHRQGWRITDASAALARRRVSSMEAAAKVLVNLGIRDPNQWPKDAGRGWRMLRQVEPLRHRIVHGFDGIDPKRLRYAARVVLELLRNREWLEDTKLPSEQGDTEPFIVGDLMAPQRIRQKSHHRSAEELNELINENAGGSPPKLPSVDELKRFLEARSHPR